MSASYGVRHYGAAAVLVDAGTMDGKISGGARVLVPHLAPDPKRFVDEILVAHTSSS